MYLFITDDYISLQPQGFPPNGYNPGPLKGKHDSKYNHLVIPIPAVKLLSLFSLLHSNLEKTKVLSMHGHPEFINQSDYKLLQALFCKSSHRNVWV